MSEGVDYSTASLIPEASLPGKSPSPSSTVTSTCPISPPVRVLHQFSSHTRDGVKLMHYLFYFLLYIYIYLDNDDPSIQTHLLLKSRRFVWEVVCVSDKFDGRGSCL